MEKVDSHLHVNISGCSLSKIIKYMDKEKIDRCWLLTWEEINPGCWHYEHLSVEDVYEAYLKYPSRVIPFYAPDPHWSDAAAQLWDWYKKGIRGCGELKVTLNWDSESVKAILDVVQQLRIPIVFHMEESQCRRIPYSDAIYDKLFFYGLNTTRTIYRIPRNLLQVLVNHYKPLKVRTKSYIFPGYMLDFASLETTLQSYPDVNFIAHGPMFWRNMSSNTNLDEVLIANTSITDDGIIWRLLKDYKNLYADISGVSGFNALVKDVQKTKQFLARYDDKILYGTDNTFKHQSHFLESLRLSISTYRKIFYQNAYRILNI